MSILHLARANIRQLTPYQSARRIGGSGDVWLNANESPDCASFALRDENLNRYPEFQPEALIAAYADYAQVQCSQVLASRGADEAIEVLIRTFCEPQRDKIAICPPTYGMYEVSAQTCDIEIINVPLKADFQVDYAALMAVDAKLIFLCAPNNPTGCMLDKAQLIDLLKAKENSAIVVVDEAYIEFLPEQSMAGLIKDFANLVITRTLSKAFALAGLRCGFTLAQGPVIELMSKVIAPYPIARPIADIACQALSDEGIKRMSQRVALLNRLRRELCAQLSELDIVTQVFEATGNYVLVRFDNSQRVFQSLSAQGIVVRDFSNKTRLENCLRISIGSASEMRRTVTTLCNLNKCCLSPQG